jgi:Zn-finger nucleic acid-binding protein
MRYCPACGAALAREEAPDETAELACPSCSGALQPVRLGTSLVRECAGCGGLWVDNRTFLALCRARDREAALSSGPPRAGEPPRESHVLPVAYLPCPVCGTLMNRVNFARSSGVVVDACREHGTWFGRGELQQVMEFVGRGGLRGEVPFALGDLKLAAFAPFTPEGGR